MEGKCGVRGEKKEKIKYKKRGGEGYGRPNEERE